MHYAAVLDLPRRFHCCLQIRVLCLKTKFKLLQRSLLGFLRAFRVGTRSGFGFGLSGPLVPAGRCDARGAESRAVAAEGAAGPRDQRRIFPG